MRASKCCVHATTLGAHGAAVGAPEPRARRRSCSEMVAELDSSFSQVKMLFLLEDGGEHSVKELASHLGLSLPAASRAVDGLIQRGCVTRREVRRGPALAAHRAHATTAARSWTGCSAHGSQTLEQFAADLTPEERDGLLHRVSSPSSKGSLASDRTPSTHRGQPPLVDARGDVLRAVHGDARQHRDERRAALDPAQLRRLAVRRWSGRSTPTRCPSPSCSSPAAGSATSSAAARSS